MILFQSALFHCQFSLLSSGQPLGIRMQHLHILKVGETKSTVYFSDICLRWHGSVEAETRAYDSQSNIPLVWEASSPEHIFFSIYFPRLIAPVQSYERSQIYVIGFTHLRNNQNVIIFLPKTQWSCKKINMAIKYDPFS